MQFQVPQFIETEDKIVGPLTLKQFGYVGVAAFFIFVLRYVFSPLLWLLVSGILAAAAVGLAFTKVNGRPLIAFVAAFMDSVWKPKIYVFSPSAATHSVESATPTISAKGPSVTATPGKPLFGGIRGFRNWIATSKTAIPRREKPLPRDFGRPQKEFKERYEIIRRMSGEREAVKRVDFR